VSREGFAAVGRTPSDADAALRMSVEIARTAIGNRDALVAASVGPYGAILHDGSEYRGRYGVSHDRLVDFHTERLDVLVAASPDMLAVETIPDLDEVAALVEALREFPDVPAWLTMTCSDAARTSAGQPIGDLVALARQCPSITAVGVNCTPPEHVEGVLRALAEAGAEHLVAYPNAGRAWSPVEGWSGEGTRVGTDLVSRWQEVPGLSYVGGCCGVGPEAIAGIARSLGR
jgi:homocysteine S-methyltransferase